MHEKSSVFSTERLATWPMAPFGVSAAFYEDRQKATAVTRREKPSIFRLAEMLTGSRGQSARIAIKNNGRILFIDTSDVLAVAAQGNYVSLETESHTHLLRESISTMAEKLEPYGFVRIHRSVLVNGNWVEEIGPNMAGEYQLILKGGREFTVTRTYKRNLKALADVWLGKETFPNC